MEEPLSDFLSSSEWESVPGGVQSRIQDDYNENSGATALTEVYNVLQSGKGWSVSREETDAQRH